MDSANSHNTEEHRSQRRILKNTSFLTGAFIVQKVISFLYFILIARRIGPVDLGLYDPLKSLIPISLILIDFSLSAVMTREIARHPEKSRQYISTVIGVKILFAVILFFVAGLITTFGNFDAVTRSLLYLVGMIVVLDTFTLTIFAVFRGYQNMLFESIAIVVNQILTIGIGAGALLMGYGLKGLFIATLVGSVFNFIFAFVMLKRRLGISLVPVWDKELIKALLKMALPFAIAAIFVKMFTYTDRYMLLALAGKKYVGWYATAHKLTYALEFIPSAFAASIYPAMSAYFLTSKENLTRTFEKSMRYLLLIAVPLSLGIITLSDRIIVQLYTNAFEASVIPLRIMISGLVIIFLNFPVGALLNASNQQTRNTINMGITVLVNVLLNVILIPKFNFVGAAISTLVSTVLLFSLGLFWAGKIVPYNRRALALLFAKCVASGAVMSAVIYVLSQKITFDISSHFSVAGSYVQIMVYYGLLALCGAIVYIVTLALIKGVHISEAKSFLGILRRKEQ